MTAMTEDDAKLKIATAMAGLRPDQRERVLKRVSVQVEERLAEKNAEVARLSAKVKHHEATAADLRARSDALKSIAPWGKLPTYQLERNEHTRLHKLIEAHAAGKVLDEDGTPLPAEHAPWLEHAKSFVVQHDWAAAFANATDYGEGDFNLPYQECAFEFRISGKTVIVISFQPDPAVLATRPEITTTMPSLPYVECTGGYWYCGGERARNDRLFKFAWEQLRAICIALDAEVASHEVVRAPTALNAKRERKGEPLIADFHIVSLRGRQVRQQLPGQHGTHRSPRLHFRRGHWRHYEAHKTWIRWTLVGDPELGFIDKAYRL